MGNWSSSQATYFRVQETFTIYIDEPGKRLHAVHVKPSDTVKSLKETLHDEGMPPPQVQSLFWKAADLDDGFTLSENLPRVRR